MSNFTESIKLTLQNFGADLSDMFHAPQKIMKQYSDISVILIFIFILSVFFEISFKLTKKYFMNKFLNKDYEFNWFNPAKQNRGNIFVSLTILIIIFYIDAYKHCWAKKLLRVQFFEITKQMLVTLLPLYAIFFMIQHIPIYYYFRKQTTIPMQLLLNLFEGFILFILYNWSINFRNHYEYSKCNNYTQSDLDAQKKSEENKFQSEFRFKDKPFYNDPDIRQVETKITTVQTTRDPKDIVYRKPKKKIIS